MVGRLCICGPRSLENVITRTVLCGIWLSCWVKLLFVEHPDVLIFHGRVQMPSGEQKDKKWWSLISNELFSVKSFYNFLNDGCTRCQVAKLFRCWSCPRKINFLNWLSGRIRSFLWKIWRSGDVIGCRLLPVWCATRRLNLLIIFSLCAISRNKCGIILWRCYSCLILPVNATSIGYLEVSLESVKKVSWRFNCKSLCVEYLVC